MSENTELTCPKCEGSMRSYERNGIQIEQCRECRGIFLDRGELERMIDAEAEYVPGPAPDQSPGPRYQEERSHGHGSSHGYGGYGNKKRKKSSFLSELFE